MNYNYNLHFISETDHSESNISNRTVNNIISAWHESGNSIYEIRPDSPEKDKKNLIELISDCIKEEGGEISSQKKVIHLAMIYINLPMLRKAKFLNILAQYFDVDINTIFEKVQNLRISDNEEQIIKSELELRDALIPPRVKFLRKLINLPNGYIFLKDIRSDLLSLTDLSPRLIKLSDEIKTLLITYFDINLLDLVEISWNSPAALLERLMEYEAVHKIGSWKGLKHRLLTDHRVFAFFHYKMPDEPLIFVEVALVVGMSDNIQKLIDVKEKSGDPKKADTAIFYSISSTQKGLEGISFGNFLIKRVVKKLSDEYKNLKCFATLSPIPKFMCWLTSFLQNNENNFLQPDEIIKICNISGIKDAGLGLLEILNIKNWYKSNDISDVIKKPLMRLCAHYLLNIKHKSSFKAYDPVANFHLSNGAKIEHINWLADTSTKGIKVSAGIMVNYHYRLDKITINHENYMNNGIVHASSDTKKWIG